MRAINPFETGNEVLDELRDYQLAAYAMAQPAKRSAFIAEALSDFPADDLMDRCWDTTTNAAYAPTPENRGQTYQEFLRSISFGAKLVGYGHWRSEQFGVDSIVVVFAGAKVFSGLSPAESAAFTRLRLRVPVMAVQSFVEREEMDA